MSPSISKVLARQRFRESATPHCSTRRCWTSPPISCGLPSAGRSRAKRRLRSSPGGNESSLARRYRMQDLPENAVLQLKRARTVVLVISGGHRDDEIEVRNDADVLPAPA